MSQHRPCIRETKRQPLRSRRAFARRAAVSFAAASVFVGVSLRGGMVGYQVLEGRAWIDAFVTAAMILSGKGPLRAPKTWGGRLFAGLCALDSGPAVIVAGGIRFAPVVHRMLHPFHVEPRGENESGRRGPGGVQYERPMHREQLRADVSDGWQ